MEKIIKLLVTVIFIIMVFTLAACLNESQIMIKDQKTLDSYFSYLFKTNYKAQTTTIESYYLELVLK